jgi:hypothetical protein
MEIRENPEKRDQSSLYHRLRWCYIVLVQWTKVM